MAQRFKRGDKVRWNSHGGKTRSKGEAHGTVVRKLTSPITIKGHRVQASSDNPEYLVRSDNGGEAAHKPSALKKG
jgi:hypothetical protein